MSAISIGGRNHGAAIARVAADWLGLAAAPTFATMTLMTAAFGRGMEPLCSAHGSLMSGMAPMYLMMSAFHVSPWLRLISTDRSRGRST
jgi:hypothetical protein